jgi:hypothetical protein
VGGGYPCEVLPVPSLLRFHNLTTQGPVHLSFPSPEPSATSTDRRTASPLRPPK